jgi:two-component system NtrC family sensor kinase
LLWTLLVHSLIAVALAGAMAWLVSGSILRPLERFVAFLEHVTRTGEYGHRISDEGGPVEVQRLRATYNHMIDTLMSDFLRIERLRESEKMAALGRMLSGAAHEINNPLTGVVGHVDLLLGRTDVDPAVRRPLETVQRDAHRVAALVRNLLKTSHRDEGRRAVADVNRMLRDAVSLRQHDFVNGGIGLALDLVPGTLPVLGNELALQQVFVNIIGNAYDALREAGGARHLTIVTTRQGATAVITFADDGPGMKNPERVFEPFYTTKGVGKGTGLGLSLSYATVHDHGGAITATNRDGGGACFTVHLPVAADAPARAAGDGDAGPRAPRLREDTALAPGWSVLVVDDEASVLDVQVQILTAMGARVTAVANAADALTALGGGAFDLVISDMKMPGGMSGPDLYRWTREHLPAFTGRFLFVTGDTFAASADEFLRDSELPYLMKPFSIDEYTAHVQEVLRDARRAA